MVDNAFCKRETIIDDAIKAIQNEYGICFPSSFIQHHVSEDFEKFSNHSFIVNGNSFDVDYFYPVLSENKLSLSDIIKYDQQDGFISKKMFAFARDEGGDRYYWDSLSQNIYYILCEDVDDPIFVCDNMDVFFSLIGF